MEEANNPAARRSAPLHKGGNRREHPRNERQRANSCARFRPDCEKHNPLSVAPHPQRATVQPRVTFAKCVGIGRFAAGVLFASHMRAGSH